MHKSEKYCYKPLPEPILITEQQWPEETLPLVTTRTITYMHEPYIRDCIEGILMQKTTFPVEVVIHDDASTDKTANIIREYEAKHPRLIKAICQKENQFSKPGKGTMREDINRAVHGKYLALCEGDDYWTDPLKLQKQVEILERYSNFVLCTHDYIIKYEHKNILPEIKSISTPYLTQKQFLPGIFKVTLADFCNHTTGIHTASIVYRAESLESAPKWASVAPSGDFIRNIMLLKKGDGAFLNNLMSILRKNSGGITQINRDGQNQFKRAYDNFYILARLVPNNQKKKFINRLIKIYTKMILGYYDPIIPMLFRLRSIPLFFYHIALILFSFLKVGYGKNK